MCNEMQRVLKQIKNAQSPLIQALSTFHQRVREVAKRPVDVCFATDRSGAETEPWVRVIRVASNAKGLGLTLQSFCVLTCARGFEPPTFWSVAKRSIQLSYAHIFINYITFKASKQPLCNAEYIIIMRIFSQQKFVDYVVCMCYKYIVTFVTWRHLIITKVNIRTQGIGQMV